MKAKKLWEIPWTGPNSVAARNMILTGNGYFYILCYPESVTESELHLYKFKIEDGSHEILGNSIPIFSDKITTNANLFYDKELGKLITIVEESPDDIKSSVTLYSIEYPPRAADANHNGNGTVGTRKKTWLAFASSLFAIVLLASFIIIYKKRKKTSMKPDAGKPALTAKGTTRLKPFESKVNSIFLFGGFYVKDRDGEDISVLFTEKIKELFCLVLQYSDDGGISSKRLSGLIWPDKEENKAKNIRGVTINSLRKILGHLDGIELIFEEGKFRIIIGKELFCDYTEYERLIASKDFGSDDLIRILARGNVLCEEEDPIFDKMKDEVESTAEPAMETEMIERYRSSDYQNAILCSDIIFSMDPLNETALSYSVRALMALGRDDDAKLRYNSFITLYKHDYEEDYPKTFESF
jgi:DNA-binding SARP family transcriptional activator